MKVVLLTTTGADEVSPKERILILTPFSHVTVFRVYEIFQFCKSLGFSQKQSMVPDFSMYFDMKSLSFIKINPQKVSKPLYLQELVQANKLRCQCMIFSPKLFCTFSHLHSFQYSIFGHREIFKRDNFWSVFASLHFRVYMYFQKVKELCK